MIFILKATGWGHGNGWLYCGISPLIKAKVVCSWPILCSSTFNLFSAMPRNVSSLACYAAVTFSIAASNISPQALFFNLAIFFNGLCPLLSSLWVKNAMTPVYHWSSSLQIVSTASHSQASILFHPKAGTMRLPFGL